MDQVGDLRSGAVSPECMSDVPYSGRQGRGVCRLLQGEGEEEGGGGDPDRHVPPQPRQARRHRRQVAMADCEAGERTDTESVLQIHMYCTQNWF